MNGYFEKLPLTFDVAPLLAELDSAPWVWNRRRERREFPDSPHRDVDDIWLRFHPAGLPRTVQEPFFSVWYPESEALSDAKRICSDVIHFVRATYLGGILITRIPPGKRVFSHHDRGPWHAGFHETKVYVALKSNEDCTNLFGPIGVEESFTMAAGEVWQFNNQVFHQCLNDGGSDRISLIISMSCR